MSSPVLSSQPRATLRGHEINVNTVAFSPDGRLLASGGDDGMVQLWDVATGAVRNTLKADAKYVHSVAFSPDGRLLASGHANYSASVWDMATGSRRFTLEGHRNVVFSVAFNPDGQTLATGSADKTIGLWDVGTGQPKDALLGHTNDVFVVRFRPDGSTLASASADETVILWDVASGTEQVSLKGHAEMPTALAYTPDGKILASGSKDKTIILWKLPATGKMPVLTGHTGTIWGLACSPDGRTLASASADKTIRLWDLVTGTERVCLQTPALVFAVAFSPDGKTLASGHVDKSIRLWDMASPALPPEPAAAATATVETTVQFICSKCKAKLRVKSSLGGKRVKCPKCKAVVTTPRSADVTAPPAPVAVAPASVRRPGPPREIVNSIGMKFVLIPAGTFLMGSPDSERFRSADEGPVHEVEITRPFYLGIFPVTVGQFRAFVEDNKDFKTQAEREDGACRWDGGLWKKDRKCNWRDPGFSQTDDHPVTCVSWNDAQAFLEWLTSLPEETKTGRLYRLPTEAEWEYSCRGGASSEIFHFGNSLSSTQANFNGDYPYGVGALKGPFRKGTTAVGFYKKANAWGLHDMHGNVWEWCSDWYDWSYYANNQRSDPPGPERGSGRVRRGGGWDYHAYVCRSACRTGDTPAYRTGYLGFRVAVVLSGAQ